MVCQHLDFTLRLPWQLGADFFYRHLLDGDPATNTLSWRWVAGLHTKGKLYAATRENILRNARDRAQKHPAGLQKLVQQPEALTEHPQWPTEPQALDFPEEVSAPTYAELLVIHEDDLGYKLPVRAEQVIDLAPQPRSSLATANSVVTFSRQLLTEAVESVGGKPRTPALPATAEDILEFALRNKIRNVVALSLPSVR